MEGLLVILNARARKEVPIHSSLIILKTDNIWTFSPPRQNWTKFTFQAAPSLPREEKNVSHVMNPSFIQYHVNLTESKHNPPSSTLLGQNSYGQNCLGGLSTFINLYLMTKKNFLMLHALAI